MLIGLDGHYTPLETCIEPLYVIVPVFTCAYLWAFTKSRSSPAWLDAIAMQFGANIIGILLLTIDSVHHPVPDGILYSIHPTFFLNYELHALLSRLFFARAAFGGLLCYYFIQTPEKKLRYRYFRYAVASLITLAISGFPELPAL